ncbi:D-alanyl-lipoteichoic acid biosynthesis protein DltD [Pectobacterium carotovorum]|uniref:D-alanyl-lipoteichoic acid biosynthesis protein DltD n=1 Tax=Pectobacterium carotovorum TaxID=554 RepID=UPI00057E4AA3|nr:D-alanyl-lipoteichoic acid biosynthesis protein DltD [Pectobacterium carotovorum]KHT35314.1 DltD [Pectobacterium carotovorum subsp. carotovorum]RJL42083.1 DltD [Pectobacterium carotovorum]UFT93227.1 D-alanyl-lipoteichoic acid biosynthesis protein DltD [Pectobacterium carotovorum]
MKIKNTLCLHILMATLAILFLSVPPLVASIDPTLTFQPLINTMEGTAKEQKEKIATISHALQGNAIFFLGASEVSTSEDEHYAVYNYFNNQLHRPVVAYGDSYVDSVTHFLLLSRFKNDLNANSKVVLLLAPDSFYSDGIPPAIFANNFPAPVFNPLMKDEQARPFLVNYLQHIDKEEISHLTFGQMKVYGWDPQIIWQEVSYQFANFCELIKNDWLAMLHIVPQSAQRWPQQPTSNMTPDWNRELAQAHVLNQSRQQSAETLWMDKSVFADDQTPEEWDNAPIVPAQMEALRATIQLLKARNVQFVVIVDPINPWAINNSQKFQPVDSQIRSMLEENQVRYFDMYAQPYQNGWNWDRLHPTEPAWVAMDQFIAESFK